MTITIWVKPEKLDQIINLISYLEDGYFVSETELTNHNSSYTFKPISDWSQVQISKLVYHKLSDF